MKRFNGFGKKGSKRPLEADEYRVEVVVADRVMPDMQALGKLWNLFQRLNRRSMANWHLTDDARFSDEVELIRMIESGEAFWTLKAAYWRCADLTEELAKLKAKEKGE